MQRDDILYRNKLELKIEECRRDMHKIQIKKKTTKSDEEKLEKLKEEHSQLVWQKNKFLELHGGDE